ncbi:unnamed protein product, partial [Allacma fusca]
MLPDIFGGYSTLNEESFFWTWNPKEGTRPSKIQFKVTAINARHASSTEWIYWVVSSPVIQFRQNIPFTKQSDFLPEKYYCYKDIVHAQSERNFVLEKDQSEIIHMSQEFLEDLYPELRIPASTNTFFQKTPESTSSTPGSDNKTADTAQMTSGVCTNDKSLIKKYGNTRFAYMIPDIASGFNTLNQESFFWTWNPKEELRKSTTEHTKSPFRLLPSPTVESTIIINEVTTTMPSVFLNQLPVEYDETEGVVCTTLDYFNVDVDPLKTPPPVYIKLYEIMGDSNADVLSVVLHRQRSISFHYVSVTALNQNGVPAGHFGNKACPDPNTKMKGLRVFDEECTDDPQLIRKYGHTRYASIIIPFEPTEGESLDQESIFWYWNAKDGDRPEKIQFKMIVVRETGIQENPKEYWIQVRSPVVRFREKIKTKGFNREDDGSNSCYVNKLSETSDRNFYIDPSDSQIPMNKVFMSSLLALTDEGESTTESPVHSTSTSTNIDESTKTAIESSSTTPSESASTVSKDSSTSSPEWTTIEPVQGVPTLVQQGVMCNQVKHFEVEGRPSKSFSPVHLKIFEIMGDGNANTLAILIEPNSTAPVPSIQYLIIIALNEEGTPVGHFGHHACSDPNPQRQGRLQISHRCTTNKTLNQKYGPTRFAYLIPDVAAGYTSLNTETFFWTWNPVDGHRPRKIQFILTAIYENKSAIERYRYWITPSPVIEFLDKIKWTPLEDISHSMYPCYKNELTAWAERNFFLSTVPSEIKISDEFLEDLYPEL